jgi:hypothetical protein
MSYSSRDIGCKECNGGYLGLESYCNCNTTMVPVPAQVRSSSQVIVPVFGTISYNSLSRGAEEGVASGMSYLPVSRAYRTSCCNQFMSRTY